MVLHTSGEFIRDTAYFSLGEEKGKSSAQVAGSIISYLRRYSYSGVLGVVTDDDEDGDIPQKQEAVLKVHPQRMWNMALKEAIVKGGYAVNEFDAKGMLDLSRFHEDAPTKNVLFWAKAYRAARDEDNLPVAAAQIANEAYDAEVERRKQDKATDPK